MVQPQRHILIVDDEAIVGLCLASELEDLGHRVSGPFTRSADAATLLRTETPDVAIVDVGVRDNAGLDLARQLRRQGVPFVFFSGDERANRGMLVEFDDTPWVEKPALLPEILTAIDEAYDRQDATALPKVHAAPPVVTFA